MMMFYSLRNQNCQTNAFSTENFELKVFKKPTPLPRFCFNLSNSREEEKKNDDVCAICYDKLILESPEKGFEPVSVKGCNHKFHKKCIDRSFLEGKLNCPICRFNIVYSTPVVKRKIKLDSKYLHEF